MSLIQQEPVISGGVAAAVVSIAAGFGFHWSAGVVGAILAAVSLILSVIVRSKVTPAPAPPGPPATPAAPAP